MMKITALLCLLCVAGLFGASLALADEVNKEPDVSAPDEAEALIDDPVDYGKELYALVKSRDWWPAVGMVLALLVLGFRRLVVKRVEWFKTSRGGLAAVGITTLLATASLALVAQTTPSAELLYSMFLAAAVAMGGYTGVRRLLWPKKS